jgi:hypothetical protein
MEIEMIVLYICIAAGLGLGAYKYYKKLMADGKITLDEVLDLVDDVKDVVEDLPSLSQIKKMKKDELIGLCKDNGLEVSGTKADLISRLEEIQKAVE